MTQSYIMWPSLKLRMGPFRFLERALAIEDGCYFPWFVTCYNLETLRPLAAPHALRTLKPGAFGSIDPLDELLFSISKRQVITLPESW